MELVQKQTCRPMKEKTEDPEVNLYSCRHLNFDKDVKTYIRDKTAFSINSVGETRHSLAEKRN